MTAAMINMRLCQAELMKQLTPDLDSDRRCTKLNNTVEARDRRPADGMGASPEHKAAPLYTWGAQQAGEDALADAQQQLWGASVQAQQQLGGASAHALTLRLCKHAEELERHLSVISSLVEMMRQQSGDHVQTPAPQQQNA
ncbi:PREDICTED: uncharacterized protein LOC106810125 [Priapulus caudatus]|uniref:Uncharacterized protein LOC106810125 n=1 Tax=Priapulus caudatus TaxID=37621 RepID=A0ABM1E9L5_PRICU|nr:PREDICTED: uncharacterized protein LOC106810125 [Priapulus caudatus]